MPQLKRPTNPSTVIPVLCRKASHDVLSPRWNSTIRSPGRVISWKKVLSLAAAKDSRMLATAAAILQDFVTKVFKGRIDSDRRSNEHHSY